MASILSTVDTPLPWAFASIKVSNLNGGYYINSATRFPDQSPGTDMISDLADDLPAGRGCWMCFSEVPGTSMTTSPHSVLFDGLTCFAHQFSVFVFIVTRDPGLQVVKTSASPLQAIAAHKVICFFDHLCEVRRDLCGALSALQYLRVFISDTVNVVVNLF